MFIFFYEKSPNYVQTSHTQPGFSGLLLKERVQDIHVCGSSFPATDRSAKMGSLSSSESTHEYDHSKKASISMRQPAIPLV